jgi:hypothetical protein
MPAKKKLTLSAKKKLTSSRIKGPPPELGLVGRYFHIFHKDNEVQYQGIVRGSLGNGKYLVQYFEWVKGEPREMEIRSIEDMRPGRSEGCWQFYEDADQMNFWYEHYVKKHASDVGTLSQEPYNEPE